MQRCGSLFLFIQKFLNKYFLEVFDTTLLKKFADKSPTYYLIDDTERKYFSKSVLNQVNLKDSTIVLRRIQIEKELTTDGAWTMAFDFVKTKKVIGFMVATLMVERYAAANKKLSSGHNTHNQASAVQKPRLGISVFLASAI